MRYIIYIVLLILLCGLSVGLSPLIKIHTQVPNLLFLLVWLWSLEKADDDFLFLALVAGLFLDFFSGLSVGTFTVPLLLLALAGHLIIENFFVSELKLKYLALLLLPAQMLFVLLSLGVGLLLNRGGLWVSISSGGALVDNFVISFLYNLLLLYPVYVLINVVKTILRRFLEREYKVR